MKKLLRTVFTVVASYLAFSFIAWDFLWFMRESFDSVGFRGLYTILTTPIVIAIITYPHQD